MRQIGIMAGDRQLVAELHQAESEHVLIMCHGFRGSRSGGGRATALADAVNQQLGISVLRFDFTPVSSLTHQIAEIRAVAAYCRQQIGSQIYLLGRSMGGSAALVYSQQAQDVAGLCLWATPADLTSVFYRALGEAFAQLTAGTAVEVSDEYGSVMLQPDLVADFPVYDLPQCVVAIPQTPLLVIHGDQDGVVPVEQARLLYDKSCAAKEMVIVPGGDHQLHDCYAATTQAVVRWLAALVQV